MSLLLLREPHGRYLLSTWPCHQQHHIAPSIAKPVLEHDLDNLDVPARKLWRRGRQRTRQQTRRRGWGRCGWWRKWLLAAGTSTIRNVEEARHLCVPAKTTRCEAGLQGRIGRDSVVGCDVAQDLLQPRLKVQCGGLLGRGGASQDNLKELLPGCREAGLLHAPALRSREVEQAFGHQALERGGERFTEGVGSAQDAQLHARRRRGRRERGWWRRERWRRGWRQRRWL